MMAKNHWHPSDEGFVVTRTTKRYWEWHEANGYGVPCHSLLSKTRELKVNHLRWRAACRVMGRAKAAKTMDAGHDETALIVPSSTYILKGNHFEAFRKVLGRGGDEAAHALFTRLAKTHLSSWSDDHAQDHMRRIEEHLQ